MIVYMGFLFCDVIADKAHTVSDKALHVRKGDQVLYKCMLPQFGVYILQKMCLNYNRSSVVLPVGYVVADGSLSTVVGLNPQTLACKNFIGHHSIPGDLTFLSV